jgi:hypothetical protein
VGRSSSGLQGGKQGKVAERAAFYPRPACDGSGPSSGSEGARLTVKKKERRLGSLLVMAGPYQKLVAIVLCLFEAVKGRFA